jgi:hypothetical protein
VVQNKGETNTNACGSNVAHIGAVLHPATHLRSSSCFMLYLICAASGRAVSERSTCHACNAQSQQQRSQHVLGAMKRDRKSETTPQPRVLRPQYCRPPAEQQRLTSCNAGGTLMLYSIVLFIRQSMTPLVWDALTHGPDY